MTRRWTMVALLALVVLGVLGYWLLVLVFGTHAVTAGGGGEAVRGLLAPGPV